ncbi:asparaginase [Granulicoccus phenolivorans]|uniref:asparaginase n=1 Tax=Granulicoccus phenolivorans TaxID=266854 RepID=UPI000428A0DA|nr:asparaginase [Granulicoccus phenolivorans]
MSAAGANPVLVEVVRGDLVESVHRGRVAVVGPHDAVAGIGAIEELIYPRSASKPMQAVAMLRSGLDLTGELLALAAASHSGEDFHLEGVQTILAGCSLGVDRLQNTPGYPLDDAARDAWIRAGHGPAPITMNCSGKHAAMLRTCIRNKWSTTNYLDPEHPLQQAIHDTIADLTGEPPQAGTVDGCGAPLWALTPIALARAYARIAVAADGPAAAVARAYRQFPQWVSGTRRAEYALHRGVPGIICKIGAEAVYAVGLPDGRGIVVKIDDGSERACSVVMSAVLRRLGIRADVLAAQASEPVLGHGRPVGEVRLAAGAVDGLTAYS